MKESILFTLTLILLSKFTLGRDPDYWDEDYDQDKNCKSEDIIKTLQSQKLCVTNTLEDPNQSIEHCKRTLTQEVLRPCVTNTINITKTGELLYCHSMSHTTCCIHNFTCKGFKETNENIKYIAANYMSDKEVYLGKEVRKRGFHSCYPITGNKKQGI